jgi:hypothetical protein
LITAAERKARALFMHPRERVVLLLSVIANLAIIAGVIVLLVLAPKAWMGEHPRLESLAKKVQAAAIIAVVVVPFVPILRRARLALIRENSVRLGRDQIPELHAILERQAAALGFEQVPELYVSASAGPNELAISAQLAGGTQAIVINLSLFSGLHSLAGRRDVFAFILAHELGRLLLGHAVWWEELFLGYLKRIPVLRLPLLTVQTLSRDRVAATLAPDGIRGLVYQAIGGDLIDEVDVPAYVRRVLDGPTPWSWAASFRRPAPHISLRVRALYRQGLFDLDRDLARQQTALSSIEDLHS